MLSTRDKDYIRSNFLKTVKSGKQRSRIIALATYLSDGEKDAEEAYLSVLHHFADPKNNKEFEKDYKYYLGSGATPYIPEGNRKGKK
jgi:hypothetical protein